MFKPFSRLVVLFGLCGLLWVSYGYAQFGNAPAKLDSSRSRTTCTSSTTTSCRAT